MISKEDLKKREELLSGLRENKIICDAISDWTEENCKRLENPKLWNKTDFEIDGKASLKAAITLRTIISKLIRGSYLLPVGSCINILSSG